MVHRKGTFTEWDNILKPGPDSYKKDAEVLCKFANQFKILGFELTDISPNPNWVSNYLGRKSVSTVTYNPNPSNKCSLNSR